MLALTIRPGFRVSARQPGTPGRLDFRVMPADPPTLLVRGAGYALSGSPLIAWTPIALGPPVEVVSLATGDRLVIRASPETGDSRGNGPAVRDGLRLAFDEWPASGRAWPGKGEHLFDIVRGSSATAGRLVRRARP